MASWAKHVHFSLRSREIGKPVFLTDPYCRGYGRISYRNALNDDEAFQSSGPMGAANRLPLFVVFHYHFLRSSITRSCDWRMADFIMAERIFRLSFCYSLSRFLWNQSLSLACCLSRSRISVSRRISSWVGAREGVVTGTVAAAAV